MENTTQKTHKKKKSCIKENRNLNFYKTFYWEKNKQEFADTIVWILLCLGFKPLYEEARATQQQLSLGKNVSILAINEKLHLVIAKQLKLFPI